MPTARKNLVSLEATPYYHIICRCCRRSFIMGIDNVSKKDYSHRRVWLEARLEELPKIFNIKIASYAIMSNHYHLVLFMDKAESDVLTDLDVVVRWHELYNGMVLTRKFEEGKNLSEVELVAVQDKITEYRKRLIDLGWFMRNINEPLARAANFEDNCTGRFWEGRFKSQALLDEKALLACMVYVDLNPLFFDIERVASMEQTPETSNFTSIKKRIEKAVKSESPNELDEQVESLLNFAGQEKLNMPKGIPCRLSSYIELVGWTGRQTRKGKSGKIDSDVPELIQRLNLDPEKWVQITSGFESKFKGIVGGAKSIVAKFKEFSRKRALDLSNCEFYFDK
ncbi:MAG: transposase [Saccharospirillaceae bacterium]|nr:transposase [Saccharospirillaceae bacterium]